MGTWELQHDRLDTVLAFAAATLALSMALPVLAADTVDHTGAAPSVRVSGLASGDVVAGPDLTLSVEPAGFELGPPDTGAAPLDGRGHYEVLLDGELNGVYAETDAIVDLRRLAPGSHELTVVVALDGHSELADSDVVIPFEYRPEDPDPAQNVVTISLREWSLEPDELSLSAGTYTFVAANDGVIPHSLVIVGKDLRMGTPDAAYDPGMSESFTVELAPGEYEILCPLPWHKATGMAGKIMVVP